MTRLQKMLQSPQYEWVWALNSLWKRAFVTTHIVKPYITSFLKTSFLLIILLANSLTQAQSSSVPGWDETEVATFGNWLTDFAIPPGAEQLAIAPVNKTFSTDRQKVFTLDLTPTQGFDPKLEPFYGVHLSGSLKLRSDTSLVRIILVDSASIEHLVYETYPLIVSNTSYSLAGVCEETCFLGPLNDAALRIELIDALITVDELAYLTSGVPLPSSITSTQKQIKVDQNAVRINKIQQQITDQGLKWNAGETSISTLPFDQKRKLFGEINISSFPPLGEAVPLEDVIINLQGAEYYKGGIFELNIDRGSAPRPVTPDTNGFIDSFDWRNRHGANNPESPYYDGDPSGSGWITSVKNQGGCGSCWAFAATGATEALANLYFNQHLDLDLAEQDVVSCSGAGSCGGGWAASALDYYTDVGVVDEACFPYTATDQPCDNICANPSERIQISGKEVFSSVIPNPEEELKRLIIENGPLSGRVDSMHHAMTLVGYEKDPDDGETVWIFKNSWGIGWGENGYWKIKTPIDNHNWTSVLKTPVIPVISSTPLEISCDDRDGDGFYNWGIATTMPPVCPQGIPTEKDCDDSDDSLGPFLANGDCSDSGLLVSEMSDRSGAKILDKSAIYQGKEICVYSPLQHGVNQVAFFLDGSLERIERVPPFDFAGTGPNRSCKLFDTTSLSTGQHTISAEIEFDDGIVATQVADFKIISGLLLSRSADRADPAFLEDEPVVQGESICIYFGLDTGIDRVTFFLDGSFERIERVPPFDFAGTGPNRSCKLFDTTSLSMGQHTISAEIEFEDASVGTREANFVITPDLLVSRFVERIDPEPLAGTTVTPGEEICVFAHPDTGIDRVTFSLDGDFERIERVPPFDFAGTGPNRSCKLFDTTSLSIGQHAISAEIEFDDGSVGTREAGFTVSNDNFANAIEIVGTVGTTRGTNVGATLEPGEPQHADVPVGASVWWRWMASTSERMSIDTFGSDYDTVLAVYRGDAVDALEEVASNDDTRSLQSHVAFTATAGTEYWIAVGGYSGQTGNITLNWDLLPGDLFLSHAFDRSDARLLNYSAIVRGDEICVFFHAQTDINEVTFYLDGSFQRIERVPPFDFAGTGPNQSCNFFDTIDLSLGIHMISAEALLEDSSIFNVAAEFYVQTP